MKKILALCLLGLVFFLIGFFVARRLFPAPHVVLPLELVSLNQQVWLGAFLIEALGQGVKSLMSNTI
jgi:hypothetical protein